MGHRHHHWVALVSRGWAKTSACRLQVRLSCDVFCLIVSLPCLSRSSLHRWTGLPCCVHGLQVVIRVVHWSSLRRLMPWTTSFYLTLLIMSVPCVPSLTLMFIVLSLYVMLSIRLSIVVRAAAILRWASLTICHSWQHM